MKITVKKINGQRTSESLVVACSRDNSKERAIFAAAKEAGKKFSALVNTFGAASYHDAVSAAAYNAAAAAYAAAYAAAIGGSRKKHAVAVAVIGGAK